MLRFDPAFVMFVGYSFGKNEFGYDDDVSLETFIGRFRSLPLDVYVLEPRPFDLVHMLRERLHSKRVHPFAVLLRTPCGGGIAHGGTRLGAVNDDGVISNTSMASAGQR